jgi:tetratricopeptide (TPR) repeat protein
MEPTLPKSTNFFSLILPFLVKGMDLTLTMRSSEGKVTVGVRPNHSGVKDDTFKSIPSLVLTHPAADLDESFFTTITAPMDKVQALAEALQSWESKFQSVKATADKTMEGKPPVAASPSTSSKKKAAARKKPVTTKSAAVKKAVPAAKKAKAPAAPKKSAKELQAEKTEALTLKYKTLFDKSKELLAENKFDEALKTAQQALRLPSNAGNMRLVSEMVLAIKSAKLQSRVDSVKKEYESIVTPGTHTSVYKTHVLELATLRKQVKGLMGVDSQHKGVIDLWRQMLEDEENAKQLDRELKANEMIDRAHALIKGQEFGNAVKLLKEIIKLDPANEKAKEIREDLNIKLGVGFVNQLYNAK